MDLKDEKILFLLEAIDEKECQSQRELSKKLKISLGLVNSFIKDLTNQGVFKIVNLPKNKVQYILTPKGVVKKANLTRQYLSFSVRYYKVIKRRVSNVLESFINNKVRKIIFYGAGDICEIACVIVGENNFSDVKIIDTDKAGRKICRRLIHDVSKLEKFEFDAVVIMDSENVSVDRDKLIAKGIPADKIFTILN